MDYDLGRPVLGAVSLILSPPNLIRAIFNVTNDEVPWAPVPATPGKRNEFAQPSGSSIAVLARHIS
jgi:hypothetical protein